MMCVFQTTVVHVHHSDNSPVQFDDANKGIPSDSKATVADQSGL